MFPTQGIEGESGEEVRGQKGGRWEGSDQSEVDGDGDNDNDGDDDNDNNVDDGHLPSLDVPGGHQPSSKLRVAVDLDREARPIAFPGGENGGDGNRDVEDNLLPRSLMTMSCVFWLGCNDSNIRCLSPVLFPVSLTGGHQAASWAELGREIETPKAALSFLGSWLFIWLYAVIWRDRHDNTGIESEQLDLVTLGWDLSGTWRRGQQVTAADRKLRIFGRA